MNVNRYQYRYWIGIEDIFWDKIKYMVKNDIKKRIFFSSQNT